MLKVLAVIAFLLVAAALYLLILARHVQSIFRLVTGRVPAYRIVRAALFVVVLIAILFPILIHFERKSPLHLKMKPAAEECVATSDTAINLLGQPLTFGSEWTFSYEEQGDNGSGDFSFPVHGSSATGNVEVTVQETASVWRLTSVTLVAKNRHVQIPLVLAVDSTP